MRKLVLTFLLFVTPAMGQYVPGAYNQGFVFTKQRPVTITNGGGATLTNYQVAIPLTSSNMTFANAQSLGQDVHVLSSSSGGALPFWVESWTGTTGQTGTVWIKVPSLPVGATVVYLTYDNTTAPTTASGANTFLAFDDFSTADASTLNGYYTETATTALSTGAAQTWEGTDVPHFISVLNSVNCTLGVTVYTYCAWYGLHDPTNSGIGLMGSQDLHTWVKYASNPVIAKSAGAAGCSRPSVIKVSTTLHMACESTSGTINYFTSTDGTGITWTQQTNLIPSISGGAHTPQLWLNPNDSNYYLFYANPGNVAIAYRTASTVAGIETAVDNSIINANRAFNNGGLYAPFVTYDSSNSLYIMRVENKPNISSNTSDTLWQTITLQSTSIAGPWTIQAGSANHTAGYACPESFIFSGTMTTYYCFYNGTAWTQRYTTSTVANGFAQFNKPNTATWTDVHDTTDTAPTWYLVPCATGATTPGSSGTCLYGFGVLLGTAKSPMLQTGYSSTDYIVHSNIYGVEAQDARIDMRQSATAGNEYSNQMYFNHNGTNNFYEVMLNPAFNSVGTTAAGNLFWNTWYTPEGAVHGTTETATVTISGTTYTATGTDGTYASGAAGVSLENSGATQYSYFFARQYTGTVPTVSVGAETTGNYP